MASLLCTVTAGFCTSPYALLHGLETEERDDPIYSAVRQGFEHAEGEEANTARGKL